MQKVPCLARVGTVLRTAFPRLSLLVTAPFFLFLLLSVSCDQDSSTCPTDRPGLACDEDPEFKLEALFLGPVVGPVPPPPTAVSLPRPATGQSSLTFGPGITRIPERIRPTPTPQLGSNDSVVEFPGTTVQPNATPVVQPMTPPTPAAQLLQPVPEPTLAPAPEPAATPPYSLISTPVPLPTLAPTAVPTPTVPVPSPTFTITPVPHATVRISVEAEEILVQTGQEFRVAVRVGASLVTPVDTAQAYLDFDSRQLEVLALSSGRRLEYELQSTWDNEVGQAACAAGTLREAVTAPFTLCTLTFRAMLPTGPEGTVIGFAPLSAPRETKAVLRGANSVVELASARAIVR